MSSRFLMQILALLCVVLTVAGPLVMPGVAAAQNEEELSNLAGMTATPNDCSFLIKGDDDPRERLGEIACGTVDVPENWSEPEGRRLQIAYMILKSTADQPLPDPVLHLGGGPGISPLSHGEPWATIFSVLRQDRDVILFDQRGTRLSSPLRCEAYSPALALDASPEQTGIPMTTPAYPADITDPAAILQAASEAYGPIAEACVAEVQKSGADLTQYNTRASAHDVVALVKALGYDDYNLYAISYGTRLALEIMRQLPDSGLRSVVLDSNYPPEIKSYEQFPHEPHEVAIQLFVDCERNEACHAAYPDLKERFVALLSNLRAEPVVATDGTPISDRDVIAVMQVIGANIPSAPYVPRMIAELERGEAETYLGIVSGSLFAADAAGDDGAATPESVALDYLSPARRFVLQAQAQFDLQSGGETSEFLALLNELGEEAHERQPLQEFIDRAFPGAEQEEARATLQAALDGMSDADVQEAFVVAEQTITLADLGIAGQAVAQYYSVECNERIPFQSFAAMVDNAQRLEIPDLALGVPETFVKIFAICEHWPSGEASADAAEAVWSEIPTLVMAGAYDNLTPVSWNKSAFMSLANSQFLLFPMAGHGTISYSACAQEIGRAFMANPAAPLDTACIADLEPEWVMP